MLLVTACLVARPASVTLVGGFGPSDNFFPESPFFTIFGEGGRDQIWFAQYDVGHTGVASPGTVIPQAVTDVFGTPGSQVEGFANSYGSSANSVQQFVVGNFGDVLNLNTFSWATSAPLGLVSGGTDLGLTDNFGAHITTHGADATMALYTIPGGIIPTNFQVTLDSLATYANFTDFVNALTSSGTGNINFNGR